jgi:CheY-like chemotaxis protein
MTNASTRLAMAVQVMDASSELIAVKDLDGAFIVANRAFRGAAALDNCAMSTLTNRDLFGTDVAQALTTSEHLAVLAETAIRCEVPVSWLGEARVFRVTCTPWTDDGRCQGVVMAGSLVPAGGAQGAEPLQSFAFSVGDLAHRFNNALTTVVGLTDWHLFTGQPDGTLRDDLQKIRAAATSAEQTAREIQQLTRAAAAHFVRPAPPEAPAEMQPAPVAMPGRRVLLVDDQADVRTSLSVMIRTLGYDVHAVDGGRAALAWLEHETASLVITDLGMPGMSGGELAAAIAQRHQALPVVLLTGWTDAKPEGHPGVVGVLPKPLRMAQLRQALASLIGPPATS